MTKWSEIKTGLLHLALNRDTYYSNKYPDNCLYVHDGGTVSCDCIGLIKNMVNTPQQAFNTTVGSMGNPGSPLPDWTEQQLIDACSDKSTDFTNVQEGEILMTVFDGRGEEYGHGGWFVGDFVDERYGVVCNTIECSSFYEYDGIETTWTDPATGCHYTSRGGRYIGQWDYHGHLFDYIEFDDKPTPEDEGRKAINDWITSLNGSHAAFSSIALVYDPDYYYNKYPDLKKTFGKNPTELLNHFITYGMIEGREASKKFNVEAYKNKYEDLVTAFGDCLPKYYLHYMQFGWAEDRDAT